MNNLFILAQAFLCHGTGSSVDTLLFPSIAIMQSKQLFYNFIFFKDLFYMLTVTLEVVLWLANKSYNYTTHTVKEFHY